MSEEWKQIEAVLDEKVRPSLRAHGGELEIDHLEDGVLYIKLLGQCAGCPSADLTNETLIEHELTAALPELVQKVVVVQTVSDELWEQAKRLLRDHHLSKSAAPEEKKAPPAKAGGAFQQLTSCGAARTLRQSWRSSRNWGRGRCRPRWCRSSRGCRPARPGSRRGTPPGPGR